MDFLDATARQSRATAEQRAAARRTRVATGQDATSRLLGAVRRWDDRRSRRRRAPLLADAATTTH